MSCGEATPGPLVSSCSRREKAALNETRNLQRICHSGTVLGRKKKKKQGLGWQGTGPGMFIQQAGAPPRVWFIVFSWVFMSWAKGYTTLCSRALRDSEPLLLAI